MGMKNIIEKYMEPREVGNVMAWRDRLAYGLPYSVGVSSQMAYQWYRERSKPFPDRMIVLLHTVGPDDWRYNFALDVLNEHFPEIYADLDKMGLPAGGER